MKHAINAGADEFLQRQLAHAIAIAARAHAGQLDRRGEPYILHPLAVSARCTSPEARVVAVLHDVIEDTNVRASDLEMLGIDGQLVRLVEALSRLEGETYNDYITRVIEAGPIALEVKLADLHENMRPERRYPGQEDMSRRYQKAMDRIIAAIANPNPIT